MSKYLLPDIFKSDFFCVRVIKPISRYSRSNVHYCLDSRASLPGGGGRGAYRIETQALSTGPEVRGTDTYL